tara:strand:+ start:34 stop:582 length:549 start_codon:yes stop_codon:yes gene_type:complete
MKIKIDTDVLPYHIAIMIEFVLKNRRLRLYPDGTIMNRAHCRGKETREDKWNEIKFAKNSKGYLSTIISIEGKYRRFGKHRLIYYAHNPSWDIFDSRMDNSVDHRNRNIEDNTIENLRLLTNQENQFNRDNAGYCWSKTQKRWRATICKDRKQHHLGYYDNEDDARAAYLKAKEELHIIPEN